MRHTENGTGLGEVGGNRRSGRIAQISPGRRNSSVIEWSDRNQDITANRIPPVASRGRHTCAPELSTVAGRYLRRLVTVRDTHAPSVIGNPASPEPGDRRSARIGVGHGTRVPVPAPRQPGRHFRPVPFPKRRAPRSPATQKADDKARQPTNRAAGAPFYQRKRKRERSRVRHCRRGPRPAAGPLRDAAAGPAGRRPARGPATGPDGNDRRVSAAFRCNDPLAVRASTPVGAAAPSSPR